jgi:predicted Zn-dependent protease
MSRHWLALAACALVLAACNPPQSYTPHLTDEEIRTEAMLQQQMVNDVRARGGVPKRWQNAKGMQKQFEQVGAKIEKAGAELCNELGLQGRGCYYYFDLKRSNTINAYADGENVVITTGLMRFIDNDDELAVVMAHELAHNLMDHPGAARANMSLGLLLGAALDVAAASQGVDTGGGMTSIGADAGRLQYSVEYEQEADYIGLYIMARAGYDPRKAALLWRRMSVENPDAIYVTTSHPSNPSRFVALQKAAAEVDYKRKHRLKLLPDFKHGG